MIINPQQFITEIPDLHPLSNDYINFWRTSKQRCIEGHWLGGYYMPPGLYFYTNFGTILLNKRRSNVKSIGRPWLRDLEWIFFRAWMEARGFSGFAQDEEYSGNFLLLDPDITDEFLQKYYPSTINSLNQRKEFLHPRILLEMQHPYHKGAPLYENEAYNILMLGSRDTGKAISIDTDLPTLTGSIKMRDISVGDKILSIDGQETAVLGVYPQGLRTGYRLIFSDGRELEVDKDHINTFYDINKRGLVNLTTSEILDNYKYAHKRSGHTYRFSLPQIDPINYPEKTFKLPPYLVGVLIGDGTTTTLTPKIATEDLEILDHIRDVTPGVFFKKDPTNCNYTIRVAKEFYNLYGVKNKSQNPIRQELVNLGLNVTCKDKFIPEQYLFSSYAQRLELLRGLLDTDGSITKSGNIEFISSNSKLSGQVVTLCRSLGIRCQLGTSKGTGYSKEPYYRVYINTSIPVFKLKRKLERLKTKRIPKVSLIDIKCIGEIETQCIKVDHPSSLFLATKDYIPTHNTYMVGVGIVLHQWLFNGLTSLTEDISDRGIADITVGAELAHYSNNMLTKTKFALENLPGSKTVNGRRYPSPFDQQYRGSWGAGSSVIAEYKSKQEGGWEIRGTRAAIRHRTFRDNPFAEQGTRPIAIVVEEAGHCLGKDTLVRMFDLSLKKVQDILPNDILMGPDGRERTVSLLTSGIDDLYRVSQKYGQDYVVSKGHTLVLEQKCNKPSIKDDGPKKILVENFNSLGKYRQKTTYGVKNKRLVFNELKHPILDPYYLGLWLGDGTKGKTEITRKDDEVEIIKYLEHIANLYNLKAKHTPYRTNITGIRGKPNEIIQRLTMLGVLNDKHLPQDCQFYSVPHRLELLAGLMDSDGNISGKGTSKQRYEWCQTENENFIKQVALLAKNLGFKVTLKSRIITKGFRDKELSPRTQFRLYISGEDLHTIPVKIPRKKAAQIVHKKDFNCTPIKVERMGKGEYYGFRLKEDPLFLLEDGTIVHNCSNLQDIFTNTKDNLRNGLRKTGTLMMLGTGGDMEAGTLDASRMMYEPEAYDILAFPDIWEHKGNIGLFIPAYLALNEYKDEKGISRVEEAKAALLKSRQKAKTSASGGSEVLQKEIQYRPIVPSEMFLTKSANIFPVIEARRRLSELQTNNLYELLEKKVNLFFDPSSPYNGVNYEIDFNLSAINRFPWTSDDVEGAVTIYDFPYLEDGKVPQDAYIIGCDPFRDNTGVGGSFAAIYVMKTNKYPATVGHNEIVATYVGRPYEGVNRVNEILYQLSLFYGNAKIYFENAVGNVKDYFEKIKRLDLLARQPVNVLNRKASFNTTESVIYGYPMSNDKIKWEALQYVRSWLLQLRENNVRNIDVIPDRFLLQQLISFNLDGNFDGVMGLIGCVIGLEEIYVSSKRRAEAESFSSSVDLEINKLLVNNKKLFHKIDEKFSQTAPIVPRKNQEWLSLG